MFRFDADLRVYLHREPIDFRAGINSLVTLVEQSMQLDPFARAVFAFHNRKRNRVKLLLYERTGFWLMLRRLEEDRFVWPRRQQAVIELTTEQLHWLLDGIDVDAVRRHPATAVPSRELMLPGVAGKRRRRQRVTNFRKPIARQLRYRGAHERTTNSPDCRQPPQAYIRELEARNRQLGERIRPSRGAVPACAEQALRPEQREAAGSRLRRGRADAAAEPDADEDDTDDTFALPDTGLPEAPEPARRKRGRKPLPADLPRQRIEYDLPEDQKICPCCSNAMHRMGEEISEQLHIEVKASVLQHVRFKYACRHCERHRRAHADRDRADAGAAVAGQSTPAQR